MTERGRRSKIASERWGSDIARNVLRGCENDYGLGGDRVETTGYGQQEAKEGNEELEG